VVYSDKLGFAIILDNGKFVLIRGHRATPGSEKELELESVNESAGCGCGCGCGSVNEGFYKSIMSNGGRNLFFAMVNDKTDEVKTIDAKTWLSSSLMDNASKHSKERVVKAILRNQKQFNKKVEFNMWAKKNRPNFKETMEYFFKNGFINNITNKGIKVYESKEEAVFEGRAFVAAAKKAKEEGKTEFEFNGKKYPVTLKD
jgi:phosphopantetheine adenylyltransferase